MTQRRKAGTFILASLFALVVSAQEEAAGAAQEPRLELTGWFGTTRFDQGDGSPDASKTGFRFAEAVVWPGRNVRLWYQLDNGLSIDNFALATSDRRVAAHYVGGFAHYSGRLTTRLEVGWRELPGAVEQKILRGEQVVRLGESVVAKAGAWVGRRDDQRTETIFHFGAGFPVGPRVRLDPTLFYAESGLPGERQWRGLLSGEYALERVRMAAGVAGGGARSTGGTQAIWDAFVKVSLPVAGPHLVHVLARRERVESRSTTVFAAGLTLGAGRR